MSIENLLSQSDRPLLIDVTDTIDAQRFNRIKAFILNHGDRQTFTQALNDNPHYRVGTADLYLWPTIFQENINCSPNISDFDELVIQDWKNESQVYFHIKLATDWDPIAKQTLTLPPGTEVGRVYLEMGINQPMPEVVAKMKSYLDAIEVEEVRIKEQAASLDLSVDFDPATRQVVITLANRGETDVAVDDSLCLAGVDPQNPNAPELKPGREPCNFYGADVAAASEEERSTPPKFVNNRVFISSFHVPKMLILGPGTSRVKKIPIDDIVRGIKKETGGAFVGSGRKYIKIRVEIFSAGLGHLVEKETDWIAMRDSIAPIAQNESDQP